MSGNNPSISVVVCAYTEERWDDLVMCVRGLRAQITPADEIVLVIDHNPRLFARAAAEFGDTTVVENQGPRGLSGARNQGCHDSHGAIIAFMDEDAIAAPDWLTWLVAAYADPQVLGVGGAILPAFQAGRPRWLAAEFDWVVGCTYRGMPASRSVVRNLIGCNMSFRRSVFETVGGFRSGIGRIGAHPLGCEETELCIRALHHWPSHRFIYEPHACVHHRVPESRSRWAYYRSRCYAEGLSKALVAQLVGPDALSSERSYTMRTLPAAVLAGLRDWVVRRDVAGLLRAGAVIAGLGMTTTGFVIGRLQAMDTMGGEQL